MKLFRPTPATRRNGFNVVTYLSALQTLGLTPPVDRDAIHRAFRDRAKRIHPDRFQDEDQKGVATRRIQEINTAHAYALHHWNGFELDRRWNGDRPLVNQLKVIPWKKWSVLPVTLVYGLTTIAAAGTARALAHLIGPERRTRWLDRRARAVLQKLWLLAAPHMATLVLFATVDRLVLKAWFGVSFLVMVSADVTTLVTGDRHTLRRPIYSVLAALSWSEDDSARREQRRPRWSPSSSAGNGTGWYSRT